MQVIDEQLPDVVTHGGKQELPASRVPQQPQQPQRQEAAEPARSALWYWYDAPEPVVW